MASLPVILTVTSLAYGAWRLALLESGFEAGTELRGRLEAEQPVHHGALGVDEQNVGDRGDAVELPERRRFIEVDRDDLEPCEQPGELRALQGLSLELQARPTPRSPEVDE